MINKYSTWHHPYKPAAKYKKKVAYFSMEFGIDQSFNIYSGGLGFLAGSHMRSGLELKQNMIVLVCFGSMAITIRQEMKIKP